MTELLVILLVLLAGGFVKSFTTLQIFRVGLGLHGSTVGILVFVLSVTLSFFVVNAVTPLDPFVSDLGSRPMEDVRAYVRPFLENHTSDKAREQMEELEERLKTSGSQPQEANSGEASQSLDSSKRALDASEQGSFAALLMAFLLEELNVAFQIGLLFIVPFVVIDLLVVHVMQLLQITQISSLSFSLPLKLLLFLAVDGWSLITQRLLGDYVT